MRTAFTCIGVLALLGVVGISQAAPINLEIPHYPYVFSSSVSVDYDASTGILTASGYADTYNSSESAASDYVYGNNSGFGQFTLTATINQATGTATAGELLVSGTINGEPTGPGGTYEEEVWFHSAVLNAFGYSSSFGYDFSSGEDTFEFLFAQGSDATLGQPGEPVGLILFATSDHVSGGGYPVDFLTSFGNNSNGTANTYYMPEPGTISLLTLAGLSLLARRRRA